MTDQYPLNHELAPPQANGELVFDDPWQMRVFGLARTLCEQGCFSWDDFRSELILAIGRWQGALDRSPWSYFDHFLDALLQVLSDKQMINEEELASRLAEYINRSHGHDH
ncbi:MAG TPA: nitrile hydratase accessory protein [Gammaproteobacteria bacterium]|nr:nitrile hydratase accessory protein [Gammaproteobacteria bacterium]HIK69586.1 nitrile hydratase accessory protein [Pseudomonadales bacterium]